MSSSHSFTQSANHLLFALYTPVEISEAFDLENKLPHESPRYCPFKAVWDTGATGSVITKKVVEDCGLKPIGMTLVKGVNSEAHCETFSINIRLPNKVYFTFVGVTQSRISDNIDVLIGMDLINRGDFAVTNKNSKTFFSFRIPSLEHIDFTRKRKSD